jgi:hypothetical protein
MDRQKQECWISPPFIDIEFANKFGTPVMHTADFHSNELRKDEPYNLTLSHEKVTDTLAP